MLEINNINFSFGRSGKLLDNISISFEKGKIYSLMGTNGSGKTTLFNILSGFLRQKSGMISFKNIDITNTPPYIRSNSGLGRTFQDLRIVPKLSVKENIILAMKGNPTDKWYNSVLPEVLFKTKLEALKSTADKLISGYFLGDIKDSLASEISFGQQKLLTLACCAAGGADLLLLDEPIAGINPEYMKLIAVLLKQLKETGKTVFFIEHNTEFISSVADSVFFLDQGKIKEYGNVAEMSNDSYVKEAYL
ncbi:MAG: ATP-binding cassette domain-containing protein [Ignavibacteria bacterium]|nr:ATP-binding cassette domain-containing protein [Ignavibacteria bacterium]